MNPTPTAPVAQIDLDSWNSNPLYEPLKLALGSLYFHDADEAARIGALARAGQQAGDAAGLSVAHRELSGRLGREAAENLSLKMELRALGAKYERRGQDIELANSVISTLRAQLARSQQDAERYRYMRNEAWGCGKRGRKDVHVCQFGPGVLLSAITELAEEALDVAIDAARTQHTNTTATGE